MNLAETSFALLQSDHCRAFLKSESLRTDEDFLKSVDLLKKIEQFQEKGRSRLKRQHISQERL